MWGGSPHEFDNLVLVSSSVRPSGRRRQRRALKQFPPDTTHSAVNNSYVTSDEEEVVYSKVKPAIVFDTSDGDQLAYDMYIAVKK